MSAQRWVLVGRALWGLLLLVLPGRLVKAAGGSGSSVERGIIRLLGARHLSQAVILAVAPNRRAWSIGVAADGLHGLSMAAWAGLAPKGRRPAALDVPVELLIGIGTWWARSR